MARVKYMDVRVGENLFTCRLMRLDYVSSNDMVRAEIYEWHDHPRNLFKRIIEPFKYACYRLEYWTPYTDNTTIKEWVIGLCKEIIQQDDEKFRADKEWEDI
jgi:hypothetical protein